MNLDNNNFPPEIQLRMAFTTAQTNQRSSAVEQARIRILGHDHKNLAFPLKLHKLLSCELLSHCLFWLEDGTKFAVDREGCKQNVMGVFFNETQFKSFQNKLSNYGFHKIGSFNKPQVSVPHTHGDAAYGTNFIVCCHEKFIKNDFELCKQIGTQHSSDAQVGNNTNNFVSDQPNSKIHTEDEGSINDIDPFIDLIDQIFDGNDTSLSLHVW